MTVRSDAELSDDAETYSKAVAHLRASAEAEVFLDADGRRLLLSPAARNALADVLTVLASNQEVIVSGIPAVVTTGQAADLLGVSRPTVVTLVDAGEIPATKVGTHRRIALADVLAYRDRVQTPRRESLDELTRISQELGLYNG